MPRDLLCCFSDAPLSRLHQNGNEMGSEEKLEGFSS
jgi:hypothetical protein